MRFGLRFVVPVAVLAAAAPALTEQRASVREPIKSFITFRDAEASLELPDDDRPPELRGLSHEALERAWPGWVRRRDAAIRARLDRGDEDSIVNLWLYGTSFTARARAVAADPTQIAEGPWNEVIAARLEDLLDASSDPRGNERMQFARDVFERRGLDPSAADGRAGIRRLLLAARVRAIEEFKEYRRQIESAQETDDPGSILSTHGSLFRDRGLSSDTSVLASFAVEQALRGAVETRSLGPGSVRHVGIVGPGLDITNKADGYDFYPLQTIQPFAVVESLIRLGLADARRLRVTTFDVSPRVNAHLERARRRADAGEGYLLHLPLDRAELWRPALLDYWRGFGDRVAEQVPAAAPPPGSTVAVRAMRVRPAHVSPVVPRDLNIVLERLAPGDPAERLDLLVATNVFVYYGRFEQALAVANAASMLRPGGVLLTNSALYAMPPFKRSAHHLFVEASDRHSEHLFWYQRD